MDAVARWLYTGSVWPGPGREQRGNREGSKRAEAIQARPPGPHSWTRMPTCVMADSGTGFAWCGGRAACERRMDAHGGCATSSSSVGSPRRVRRRPRL